MPSEGPALSAALPPPEALAPPPGNPRFPLFDGLRAIAALSVLLYHTSLVSGAALGFSLPARLLAQLNVGVAVFFVISGFLMYRPLLAARAGSGPPVRIRDYARRRVLRIVPGYWVALTVLSIFPGLPDMFSRHWWVYYGFLQDYAGLRAIDGIGSAWTLGCELAFYALLPLISLAFARLAGTAARRVSWRFELAALSALGLLSVAFRSLANGHNGILAANTLPGTFTWFALGMMLALASVASMAGPAGGAASERIRTARRWAPLGWPAAFVLYVLLCLVLHYAGNPFLERDSAAHVFAWYTLNGAIATCLVAPAAFDVRVSTVVGRLLAWRPLAWIGLISYGIYLYHDPLLNWIAGGAFGGDHPWLRLLRLTALTLAAAVSAAALSYYLVERPFLRLKERRGLLAGLLRGRA